MLANTSTGTEELVSETNFVIYLDDAQLNRYRHWHLADVGKVVQFVIQYEAFIAGKWHSIVRYDTAHNQPHRDLLHPDGKQTKEFFPHYTNAEILTFGQRDIVENWSVYRVNYEKEMQA